MIPNNFWLCKYWYSIFNWTCQSTCEQWIRKHFQVSCQSSVLFKRRRKVINFELETSIEFEFIFWVDFTLDWYLEHRHVSVVARVVDDCAQFVTCIEWSQVQIFLFYFFHLYFDKRIISTSYKSVERWNKIWLTLPVCRHFTVNSFTRSTVVIINLPRIISRIKVHFDIAKNVFFETNLPNLNSFQCTGWYYYFHRVLWATDRTLKYSSHARIFVDSFG